MPSSSDPKSTVNSGPGRLPIGTGRAGIPGNDHYLIDLFTSPVSSAPIVDVVTPLGGQTLVTGAFVVRVSSHIPILDPSTGNPLPPLNCGDLISKKYQGLLAFNTGYTHLTYDSLLDTSGVNLSASGTAGTFGVRNSIALNASATLTTNATTIASTPSQAIFTWEVYTYTDTDPAAGRFTRVYNEVTPGSSSTVQLSFNNGSTFFAVSDSVPFNISGPNQGNQFIAKITNTSAGRLHIGAWAVVY